MANPIRKKATIKDSRQKFSVKTVGKDTYIEGWANKAVVDRGKDIIHQQAWDVENFKKVPTILFNHDKDKPIGKAVDIRPTDQGLWIKAKLSNSKDPTISMVRDLVQEGMLNAFSVGFDAKDEQKDADGINEIKNAELYEVSVVTLPMNQDSTFSLSAKSLEGLSKRELSKKILTAKGAWVAEAVHGKIYEKEKSGEGRNDILSKISSTAGVSQDDLTQILAGNITPVPEKVLGAFSQVLGMDMGQLKKLDQGDVSVEKKPEQAQQAQDQGEGQQTPPPASSTPPEAPKPYEKPGQEGDKKPAPEQKPPKPSKKDEDGDEDAIAMIGILIPKDQAQDADSAKTMVSDAGYEPIDVQEQDNAWYVLLEDPADFQEGTGTLDLGNSITAVIGLRKPMDQQEPEDQEPQPQPENQSKADQPAQTTQDDVAQAKQDYESYQRDENATVNNEPGNPASWVADEPLWDKAKRASQAALGKLDYGFVVWWYLQHGGTKKSLEGRRTKDSATTPIGQDMPVDDNPYLAQARQTNVLLGVLIKEIQTMCAAMQGGAIQAPDQQDQSQAEGKEADLQKRLDSNVRNYTVELKKKLEKLGA